MTDIASLSSGCVICWVYATIANGLVAFIQMVCAF